MKNVSFKRTAYSSGHISASYNPATDGNVDGRLYFAKEGIYLGNTATASSADLVGLSLSGLNLIFANTTDGVTIAKANLGTASTAVTQSTTDASTKIATTAFVAAAIAESAAAKLALVLAGFAHPAYDDNTFRFSNINKSLFPDTWNDIQDSCDEFYKLPDYDDVKTGYLFKVSGTGTIKLKNTGGTEDIPVETGDTIYITHDYIHVEGEGESGYITKANVVILLNNVDVFKRATASAAGIKGLVPAPTIGDVNNFLRGDGSWAKAGQVDGATINGTDLTVTDKKIIIPLAKTDGTTSTIGYGVISDTFAYNLSNLYDDWNDSDMSIGELNDAVADIDGRLDTATTKLDTIVSNADKVNNFLLAGNDESSILLRVNITNATNPSGSVNLDQEIGAATLYKAGVMSAADKVKLNSVCTWEDE